jgi:kojibiose phosphorylase
MVDTWTLREEGFDPATARAWEGLFSLGSGYLQTRGSLEEHLHDAPQNVDFLRLPANVTAERFPETTAKWGTYVPGLFGPHPTLNNEMVNLPWFLELAPFVGGEKLDLQQSRVTGCARELNLRTATLRRELTWHPAAGPAVEVCFERFVSAARPALSVQRLTLTPAAECTVRLRGGIDADVRTSGYDHLEAITLEAVDEDGVACSVRTNGGDACAMLCRLAAAGAAWRYVGGERRAAREAEVALSAGQPLVVEKRTAVATSRDPEPRSPAAVLAAAAELSGAELHAEHAAEWAARWERCDVVVDGDERTQIALRASLYHLLRAHVPDDRVAIDAKGYAGDAYFGRYFWDTEMYLLPFFLYTDPARARTFCEFRRRTLDGARRNAARYGYPGARYAWESDHRGEECCPSWQYADHEVHVTADVVYGWEHYAAAAEPAYLERAAEAVVETARYWLARLDWRAGEDHPSLLGVMGPDEYTPLSSNSAYTNWLVARALELAARLGEAGGAGAEECAAFRRAAAGLPVPRDETGDLVLQCEEFPRLAEPDFAAQWPDRAGCYAEAVSQERLYRTKCLKQADVLLLMTLFPDAFSDAEVRAAWDYYLPYTTHDSSLSVGIHAIVALRLGLEEEAFELFQRGLYKDVDAAHGGAAEGIHIAGCGCNWLVVVFGFAGLTSALQSRTLRLRPRLPAGWRRLVVPLTWRGTPVRITLAPAECRVENLGTEAVEAAVDGAARTVAPGAAAVWPAAGDPT